MPCLAIIDAETTGLNPYRHDRIVEVAAVVIRPDGETLREFVSLINPERDMGPTGLHGITAGDVLQAPRFGEVAPALLETLNGCVAIAGHNVRFDYSFLACEFERLGHAIPECPTLCTLQMAGGGSLSTCCVDYQVGFDGNAHSALDDARATARLLAKLLADAPRKVSEISGWPSIVWPRLPRTPVNPLTREESRRRQAEPPTYLQELLARAETSVPPDPDDAAVSAYTAVLDRALEDRHIDEGEGQALLEVAMRWGLTGARIKRIHREYLQQLAAVALADGTVTSAERRDLSLVGRILGVDQESLEVMLQTASRQRSERLQPPRPVAGLPGRDDLAHKQVCFTGECQCRYRDKAITRTMAMELASRGGLVVVESVTKHLDFLVVADPMTQSGKAKKARQYGIRVIHEPVFWAALGLEVG